MVEKGLLFFNFVNSQIGDHSQEELAKFWLHVVRKES
jgi:hypothetical protein